MTIKQTITEPSNSILVNKNENKNTLQVTINQESKEFTPQKLPDKPVKKNNTTIQQILNAFDIVNRFNTFTVSKRIDAESAAFDLIRVLSMCWVIMGHSFNERNQYDAAGQMDLDTKVNEAKTDWNITFIQHGLYAVDFFLFMGGYVAIISLRRIINEFRESKFWKIPILYIFLVIKRYVRIIPLVVVIVLFYTCVLTWVEP